MCCLVGGIEIPVVTRKAVVDVPNLQIAVHPETISKGISDFHIIGEIIFHRIIKIITEGVVGEGGHLSPDHLSEMVSAVLTCGSSYRNRQVFCVIIKGIRPAIIVVIKPTLADQVG